MSLVKDIQDLHDFLYSEVGGVDPLIPLMLTILDKFKEKKKLGISNPLEELKDELKELDRGDIKDTIHKINDNHLETSPLLNSLTKRAMNAIQRDSLSDPSITRIKDRILNSDGFLSGFESEEDFIGLVFESLATNSGVFNKEEGRFFTPKNIILIVIEMMAFLIESENKNLKDISVCDPCCGSARYLIYWSNRIIRENELTKTEIEEMYSKKLFGIDKVREVAGWATWNMVFHGDGATNIANADSLDYFGIIIYWNIIQDLLQEIEDNFEDVENRITQTDVKEDLDKLKTEIPIILSLKNKESIDLNSEEAISLLNVLNGLIKIQNRQQIPEFTKLDSLSNLKNNSSVNEIMKIDWKDQEITDKFDLIITNPPFGRSSNDLMETNPYILCQYKLATELWIGDMPKEITEKVLEKQMSKPIVDIYKKILKDMNITEIKEEYDIKIGNLNKDLIITLAVQNGIDTTNKTVKKLREELEDKLGRDIIVDNELTIDVDVLNASLVKKIAISILYQKEGSSSKVNKFLSDKIKEFIGKDWIKIDDVYDYANKLTLKYDNSEHSIFYDGNWNPLLFKDALPKQVLFLEEFLRIVKEGGYIFTVVDTGVLSNVEDEYVRRFLYDNSKIHAIVEYPHGAFNVAGAGVKTAVVLYQKMENPPEDYEIFGSLPQNLGYILNKQEAPPDHSHNDLGKVLCDWRRHLGGDKLCSADDDECKWVEQDYCGIWKEKVEKIEL